MPVHLASGMLAAALLAQDHAPVPAAPANSTASANAATVSENWARPVAPSPEEIRRAVRASIEEERELAGKAARDAAIPVPYRASSEPKRTQYEKFEEQFIDAKVPGCFRPDGFKRQPTPFFTGIEALVLFMPIAALRGKCN